MNGWTKRKRRAHDAGTSVVEYALLLALIALVCVGALTFFGITNGGSINNSSKSVASVMGN